MNNAIRSILLGTGICLGTFVQAQDADVTATNIDWATAPDWQVALQAIEQVPAMPAIDVTNGNTFWSAQHNPGSAEPWPPLPMNPGPGSGFSVWALGDDGVYLLSDLNFHYGAQRRHTATSQSASDLSLGMTMAADDSPITPGDGSTNDYSPAGLVGLAPDYGTNLFIAQMSQSEGNYLGIMSNTVADVQYEIQYMYDLQSTNGWQSASPYWAFTGSEVTNWTAFSVPMTISSNMFFRARSWASDDGSGIPLWWEEEYLGTNSVDPNAQDSAGDGYTIYQKYVMGSAPGTFVTPPTPQGVIASYNPSTDEASISWSPSPGPVTEYTVERDVSYGGSTQDSNVLWNVNSLADNLSSVEPDPYNANVLEVSYKVQAHYAGGNSAWSEAVPLQQADVSASIVPGPNGTTILVVSGVPANATAVRLVYYDWIESELEHDFSYNTNIDIPLSDFVNGEYVLPPSLQDLGEDAYGFEITPDFVQSVSANGDTTASDRIGNNADGTPFYDGRVQLKQNLIYLLRAASQNYPVGFTEYSTNEFYAGDYSGGYFQYTFSNPANYAWASPYHSNGSFDGNGSYYFSFDPDEPFDDNDRYLNFVFDADNLTAYGNLNTGAATSDGYALWDPEYQFTTVTTNAWLPPSDTRWLYSEWEIDQGDLITQSGQTISMASGVKNLFGLPYLSAALAYNTSSGVETGMVSAGGNFTLPSSATVGAVVYPETAQPAFQTVEYDFWNPASDPGGTPVPGVSLVPGEGGFSPTNESQLLITPVGTPLNIVGYAKLAVTNGYPGVYGYLGQYFTNAFAIDDSGNITTNSAGVISPYGNFLPLQAGPAALVTMPDPDTGQQGTCTVYCVSLNVDANHDGNMDLTFGGTDATSQANPMEFWIDDGSDVPGAGGNPDYDAPVPPASPNCVLAPFGQNQIKCPRDLENFARLWICGVPSIDSTGGYQVTLSWQNYSGNPAIILVPSYEADGGIGYLTNSTIAQNTIGYSSYGEVSPGTDLVIPDLFFDEAGTKHFLFEGSGIGEGELTMTITQNGNTIAQTGVWLDLHDIKDFYEVADATNVTSGLPPSSMISQYRIDHTTATQPNETKQVIVFVHGINNTYFDAKDSTETLFKRLYWSGYYGKVAEFKWPCAFLPFDNTLNPFNYDLGEFYAWKSAAALKDYLSYLTNRLAGYQIDILAHSQGNIVASEAIKQGAPFDNYILSQAAVSAQCYDTSVPTLSSLVAADAAVPTPLYPANGGYDGYFSGLTGNLINFYNTNDYALASGIWSGLQANWVADQKSQKPESYTYRFGQVYEYDTTNLTSTARYGFSSYTVTDPYEIMSQVARSRSSAAGAQPDIGGVMETSAQVDLLSSFGFGSTRGDHSAEFTRPIQQTFGYYQTILNKIQPAQ